MRREEKNSSNSDARKINESLFPPDAVERNDMRFVNQSSTSQKMRSCTVLDELRQNTRALLLNMLKKSVKETTNLEDVRIYPSDKYGDQIRLTSGAAWMKGSLKNV
jgi:hypothetical protein